MRRYYWKPEKNDWLKEERDISFEQIENAIKDGFLLQVKRYKGTKRIHQNQFVLVVDIEGDIWWVPITVTQTIIIMRTAYIPESE